MGLGLGLFRDGDPRGQGSSPGPQNHEPVEKAEYPVVSHWQPLQQTVGGYSLPSVFQIQGSSVYRCTVV